MTGLKLFKEKDEFYQCLKYSGCGIYVSLYNLNNGNASIELVGLGRGEGALRITYESALFKEYLIEKEKVDSGKIEDGL